MALKELQIRNIRPTDKVTQCTDDRGLYLEVHPNGSKLWRYKYRYMGKQKRLALGRYPDVGLAEARMRRDDARRQLEAGTDPLAERKHEKLVAVFKAANTFGEIARAVERYAWAAADVGQMREQGLPILPHQRVALEKAGKALDAIRPHGSADLSSALQRQRSLAREAADGRSQGAIRAMQLEAEIRIDPAKRADRFVSDWQRLGQARTTMQQGGDTDSVKRVSGRMADMAKGLERDPQVESLLRNRTRELGIDKDIARDLSRELAASVSFERTRSIGMSL